MTMKRLFAFTFAAVVVAASAGLIASTLRAEADAPESRPAPSWKLKDLDGHEVSSDEFKGKVVVIDFWATWCPPCRAEIPGYMQLQKKYGDKGLVILGVSVDQAGVGVVKKFVAGQKMNYRVLMADDAVQSAFGGFDAIPTTFVIDRSGKIRHHKTGSMETEDFEKWLTPLL